MAEKGNSPERHQKLYTKRKPFNSQIMRSQLRENKVQLPQKERPKLLFKRRLGTNEKVALPSTAQSSLIIENQMKGILTSLSSNVITLRSIREVDRLLSSTDDYNATISQVIQAGIVPRLVGCLGEGNEPEVQCEILNVLGRIVTGTTAHVHVVVECGAVPVLIHLLDSSSDLVKENALQALAHIAADCDDCIVFILDTGILQPLLRLLRSSTEASVVIRGVACLGECVGHLTDISGVLYVLYHLLEQEDEDVLKAVCSTLNDYFIAHGVSIEQGACQRLVNLLEHESVDVSFTALCAVLEVLAYGSHVSMMLNCSLLPPLVRLFQHEWLHEEICSAIYSIIASARDHLQTVIDHDAGIFQLLFNILSSSSFNDKREALCVIHSAIKTCSSEQVRAIVSSDHWHVIVGLGCIKVLCQQLRVHDPSIIVMLLDIFKKLLSVGEKDAGGGPNVYAAQVEEHNGLKIIEGLQFHENKTIRESATQIIDKYFESDT